MELPIREVMFLAQLVQLAALEFVAAPVGIDDECRLAQGQDKRRFAVAVAALQGPAPRRKRLFVNSLESHGKVSVIELLKPGPRVEQLRNVGFWKETLAACRT